MSQRITKVKKKTAGGFTEAIPIGAKAQNITLRDGTVLQDVVQELQTGRAGHADLTQAEYDALSPAQKNDGTVYFVSDGTAAGRIDAAAVHYNDTTGTLNSNYVQGAIDTLATNKVNYTDIINNLTSTNTGAALSAAQGKILQDNIDSLADKIQTGHQVVSGSIITYANSLSKGRYTAITLSDNIASEAPVTNIYWVYDIFIYSNLTAKIIAYNLSGNNNQKSIYQKLKVNGNWQSWVEMPSRTEMNNALKSMGSFTGDLNDLTISPGMYIIGAADTIQNQPDNMGYGNFIQFPASAYNGQLIFNSNALYTRQYTGNPPIWRDWKKYYSKEIFLQEITFTGSFTAGTPGTRGDQKTYSIPSPQSSYTVIGITIIDIGNSSDAHIQAFYYNNTIYCNFYRATSNSMSNNIVKVRVAYLK